MSKRRTSSKSSKSKRKSRIKMYYVYHISQSYTYESQPRIKKEKKSDLPLHSTWSMSQGEASNGNEARETTLMRREVRLRQAGAPRFLLHSVTQRSAHAGHPAREPRNGTRRRERHLAATGTSTRHSVCRHSPGRALSCRAREQSASFAMLCKRHSKSA